MPEVPGIGDEPDPDHRRRRQEARGDDSRLREPGEDDGGGAEHRQHRPRRGVAAPRVDQDDRRRDRRYSGKTDGLQKDPRHAAGPADADYAAHAPGD